MQHKLSLFALAASSTTATHILPRAASFSTITTIVKSTITTDIPATINTDFASTGVITLIPNALTVTINALPAYMYLETNMMGVSTVTVTETHKVAISASPTSSTKGASTNSKMTSTTAKSASTSSSSLKTSSTSSKITSSANIKVVSSSTSIPSTTPKTSTSKAASTNTKKTSTTQKASTAATATSSASTNIPDSQASYQNGNVPEASESCNGKAEGATCGSLRQCYQGGCYWFNYDNMCGNLTTSCNTNGGWACANGYCVNTQTDVNNCGQAYLYCGDGLSCVKGQCTDFNWDNDNCGTRGTVCKTGTGCDKGKCVDTTSDNENCSTVGYVCPAGTQCKDSWCQ